MSAVAVKMGQWLDLFKNNEEIKNNIFITSEDVRIDVTLPKRYDAKLPEVKPLDNYKITTLENIYDHFATFLDNDLRVRVINNVSLDSDMRELDTICGYCRTSQNGYRFCTECKKNMCKLCWEEKTEEIAKANGAKKWKKRKDALLLCFGHQEKMEYTKTPKVKCDVCRDLSTEKPGLWKHNRVSDKDLCPECTTKPAAEDIIKNSSDDWFTAEHLDESTRLDFGSFLDWVPVLCHEDGDAVFYNINPDSEHYHKALLRVVDNHSREGYFVVDKSLDDIIEEIRIEKDLENIDGADTQIKRYVHEKGWDIYYG